MIQNQEAPIADASARAYTTDVLYPSTFVYGQSPLQLAWAAGASGSTPPSLSGAFSYCDLGCGDGITLNLLADSFPRSRFVGIDINTDHLRIAQQLAQLAEIGNVRFLQCDFTALGAAELPEFDFIAVHGVYSWVDDAVRDAIHAFVRAHLKPGGLVAVQYSCLPGASVHDPLLNALRALADRIDGDSEQRVRRGVAELRRLAPWSEFFTKNPQAHALVRGMREDRMSALTHDVLNRRLHSYYLHEVCARFRLLGLEFIGSGNLKLNHPELMLPSDGHAIFRELTATASAEQRHELLDLFVNFESRCDVFRKPADGDGPGQGLAGLGDLWLLPAAAGASAESRRRAAAGTAIDIDASLYLDVLAAVGQGDTTLGDLVAAPALRGHGRAGIERAIAQLYMLRCLDVLVQRPRSGDYHPGGRYRLASSLNRILLERTRGNPEPIAFASPVLGTALRIPAEVRRRLRAFLRGAAGGNELTFASRAVPDLMRLGLIEAVD